MPQTNQIHFHLLRLIDYLKDAKNDANVEKVTKVIELVVKQLEPSMAEHERILDELSGMLDYINKTKAEMLGGPDIAGDAEHISIASDELDQVLQTTEQAANTIMDNGDIIMEKVGAMEGEDAQAIMAATANIFEACNFQDLTGQRIRKVMQTMEYLEQRLLNLTGAGDEETNGATGKVPSKSNRPDEELMNGPGKLGETPSQADIDALFNSLD